MAERGFTKVAQVGELAPGAMKMVRLGQDRVLLANVDGKIYACDDVCSHSNSSLSGGDLDGVVVECPNHGALFNVATGQVLAAPANEDLRVFEVRIQGQNILVGPPRT